MLGAAATADVAEIQRPNFALNTPLHVPIHTSRTLELRFKRLLKKARKAFQVDDVPHNLAADATLVDTGCSLHMYYWCFEVEYNGETIYKGCREPNSKLFKMSLIDDGTERVVLETKPVGIRWVERFGFICNSVERQLNLRMPKQRAADKILSREPRLVRQIDTASSCKHGVPPRAPRP